MINEDEKWFAQWFNTPYYHDLYRNRNDIEAMQWMDRITSLIALKKDQPILDVCCGNGRHALHLEKAGFMSYGIDISPSNIAMAQGNSQFPERWRVGDARQFNWGFSFQLVTNLFTSFGYFDNLADHQNMMSQMLRHVAEEGYFIFDFLNASRVIRDLIQEETHQGNLADYHIHRIVENGRIFKNIRFTIDGIEKHYQESVFLFEPEPLMKWIVDEGFEVQYHLGDYHANAYHQDSPRCIFVFKRK